MLKGQQSGKSVDLMDGDEIEAIIDPLGHSWKCTSMNCLYNFCQEIKKLITSTGSCTHSSLADTSCETCSELTYFINQHSNNCKEAECNIPNCKNNAQQGLRMPNKVWAIVGRCNMCARDVETDQGWYCRFCANFHVCNSCYKKELVFNHPHRLTTQNDNARQEAEQKLRSILQVLVHASWCHSKQCNPRCRKIMSLYHHGNVCQVRSRGNCPLCNRMWYILQFHAEACNKAECSVARCKEVKEHLRKFYRLS